MIEYGLQRSEIEKIQAVLAFYPDVEQAILYGSRAKGNFKPASDIDLSLVGDALVLTTLLSIETDLDDLLLPYKIDISILHQISNPDLIDHIKRVGLVFYQKKN